MEKSKCCLRKITMGVDAKLGRHRFYAGHRPVHINVVGIEVFAGSVLGRFLPEDLAERVILFLRQEIVHHECSEARALLAEMTEEK